ncbi:hypothetical protein ABZ249_28185 [Nocardiopsis sp. NPDC006139]|uniref:hypothetical protein n=1 Tax=unclassified Nocardiopsis TaxID=2649073 RepID=UPI00339E8150
MSTDRPRTFEILVPGFATGEEALAQGGAVARLLCPEPEHDGPCPIPWSTGVRLEEEEPDPVGTGHTVVAGVYATAGAARAAAERIGESLGRPAHLVEVPAQEYPELAEQYRIERGLEA